MRRFRVMCQFYGKDYLGFQKNGESKTIEREIEIAITKLFGNCTNLAGCSRTDAGVSAREFYFTFDADTKLPSDRVAYKLNRYLPNDIQCQESEEVNINYNLRKSIEYKTYEYAIYTGDHVKPIINRFAIHITDKLDTNLMISASKILTGQHNFKAFCSSGADATSFTRTITNIEIKQEENNVIKFYISADGFLYNMVRILVGTLIGIGGHQIEISDIEKMLNSGIRQFAGKTMPSKALMLYNIKLKK